MRHTARVLDRLGGLRLGALAFLCSYANWFLLCAFLAVFLAKSIALSRIAGAPHGVAGIWVLVAKDALLYFGLAAMFRVIERRVGWAAWPTALLGFLILVVSVLSAAYLVVAGELLSWQSLIVGVARFDEVRSIAAESAPVMWLVGAALFVLLAIPYSCRRRWGSRGSPALGFGVAVAAGVIGLLAPMPEQVPVARLAENVALTAFAGYLEQPSATQSAGLFGRFPTPLSGNAITQWAQARKPPNVLFFVLESTRWDVTSLAGGPADTPALAAVGGAWAEFPECQGRGAAHHQVAMVFLVWPVPGYAVGAIRSISLGRGAMPATHSWSGRVSSSVLSKCSRQLRRSTAPRCESRVRTIHGVGRHCRRATRFSRLR